MPQNRANNLIQLHLNIVVNTLDTFLSINEQFSLVIEDQNHKYASQLPDTAYNNGLVIIDIHNWTFEQSFINQGTVQFCTSVVYGESDVHDIAIDAIDILSIISISSPSIPMYTRAHQFKQAEQVPEIKSKPLPDWHNNEGIKHSMSCLKLSTLGE